MDYLETEAAKTASPSAKHSSHKPAKTGPAGLMIDEVFCPADVADPFDTVQWEMRTAAIKGEGGEVVFEQKDCEIPASWTNWPPTWSSTSTSTAK